MNISRLITNARESIVLWAISALRNLKNPPLKKVSNFFGTDHFFDEHQTAMLDQFILLYIVFYPAHYLRTVKQILLVPVKYKKAK